MNTNVARLHNYRITFSFFFVEIGKLPSSTSRTKAIPKRFVHETSHCRADGKKLLKNSQMKLSQLCVCFFLLFFIIMHICLWRTNFHMNAIKWKFFSSGNSVWGGSGIEILNTRWRVQRVEWIWSPG